MEMRVLAQSPNSLRVSCFGIFRSKGKLVCFLFPGGVFRTWGACFMTYDNDRLTRIKKRGTHYVFFCIYYLI